MDFERAARQLQTNDDGQLGGEKEVRAGLEDAGEGGAAPGGHGHRGDHRGGEAKYPDVVDPLEPARALNKRPVRAKIKHPVEWNGKLHPSLPLTPLYCLRIHNKFFRAWPARF